METFLMGKYIFVSYTIVRRTIFGTKMSEGSNRVVYFDLFFVFLGSTSSSL
jgi:hypothetical protein